MYKRYDEGKMTREMMSPDCDTNVSGASGLRVIAWSHGWDGGSFFDSTGSKILVCLLYSLGTSTSWVNFLASLDNLIEIPLSKDSLLSSWNMASS